MLHIFVKNPQIFKILSGCYLEICPLYTPKLSFTFNININCLMKSINILVSLDSSIVSLFVEWPFVAYDILNIFWHFHISHASPWPRPCYITGDISGTVYISTHMDTMWLLLLIAVYINLVNLNDYTDKCTLTHWGRVTHICVGKLTIIGSDNGLSPG